MKSIIGIDENGIICIDQICLSPEMVDDLKEFLGNNEMQMERDTLRDIVTKLHETIEKLKLDYDLELDRVTQRLRNAHLYDLRTQIKVMDQLVNIVNSRNLSPQKD